MASSSYLDDEVESVADQLMVSAVLCDFPVGSRHEFVPRSKVDEFVTKESVTKELAGASPELVAFIMDSARLTFAITVSSNVQGERLQILMESFRNSGFDDKQLPASEQAIDKLFHPALGNKLKPWINRTVREFGRKQWMFLAPIFPRQFKTLQLEPGHIFPFVTVGSDRREGTFGDVYRVTIHESHQEEPMKKARNRPRGIELLIRLGD